MKHAISALALLTLPLAALADSLDTSHGPVRVTPMVTGLDTPWAFGFLPDGAVLVTERDGRLLLARPDAPVIEVTGLGEIAVDGQGGLLDILIPRDFAQTRQVYFTHAKAQGRGAGTALARARLSDDGTRLTGWETLFEITPGSRTPYHFGSRLVEAPDGTLFMTVGDRGQREEAQNRANHQGSVLRLTRDGGVPDDNPFVGMDGVQPEIWSFGHRNPQGAALDASGQLWINEHGARGGDEVNRIAKGANYGWPVISYGTHYSGAKIGVGTEQPGMEQPVHFWDPSIAPSGMMAYKGAMFPDWRGDLFVGSLKFSYISRLNGDADTLDEVEQIAGDQTSRVRDIREAPDGSIWFLSVGEGTLFRVAR